ncbi:MAG TPA: hypothetical protein V6D23_18910 [Candidatus Obscuribacterales bacterium]
MSVLAISLMLLPLLFVVIVAVAALPLHLTVKLFGVRDSSFGAAVKVTCLAWLFSLGIGLVLGLIGMIVPVLPHALAVVAPFAVFVVLVQSSYGVNLVEALIISLIQVVIGYVLIFAMVMAVLMPLGLGAVLLGAFAGHS